MPKTKTPLQIPIAYTPEKAIRAPHYQIYASGIPQGNKHTERLDAERALNRILEELPLHSKAIFAICLIV